MVLTPKAGIFLLGACVAGIAAVGSIFEISSGDPQLGLTNTGLILAFSIPVGIILFLAAVQDANANMDK